MQIFFQDISKFGKMQAHFQDLDNEFVISQDAREPRHTHTQLGVPVSVHLADQCMVHLAYVSAQTYPQRNVNFVNFYWLDTQTYQLQQ